MQETVSPVAELVYPEGTAMKLLQDNPIEVYELPADLSMEERREKIREYLKLAVSADDILGYWKAELLYEVQENEYWKEWRYVGDDGQPTAYSSFEDFYKRELGDSSREAYYRLAMYRTFVIGLNIPVEILRKMGISKLREITSIVTPDNVYEILGALEDKTVNYTKEYVKNYRALLSGEHQDDDLDDVPEKGAITTEKAERDTTYSPIQEYEDDEPTFPSLDPEGFMTFTCELPTEVYESVVKAFEVAGMMIESNKRSAQFDVICQSFLASVVSDNGPDQYHFSLNQAKAGLERAFNVEFEVV